MASLSSKLAIAGQNLFSRSQALPRHGRPLHQTVVAMGRRAAKNALRKGKSDALKAKLYGKYGKLVLQAAKAGGSDPNANRPLQVLLEQARRAGVPREILDRSVKKSEDKTSGDISEAIYEVYGPGGTGFICECLTDNSKRAVSEIWTIVKKLNGKMADSGSVLFNFQRRGELVLKGLSEDDAFNAATEVGAEDIEPLKEEGEVVGWKVVCSVENFGTVRDGLQAMSLEPSPEESGLTYKPLALVEIEDDEVHAANETLYDRLMELDDVDAVYSTCEGVGANTD